MAHERLNVVAAGFLEAEDADKHLSMAIGALAILEGPAPDNDTLMRLLEERTARLPRGREVLRLTPLDLTAPQWVPDEHFDLAHHVRRLGAGEPGDNAAVFRVVAEAMERRLDRWRPLWECWIIDGLASHRWAMLIKIHHCIADGVAATAMLEELCDTVGGTDIAATLHAEAAMPTPRAALPMNPVTWARNAWQVSAAASRMALRAAAGAVEVVAGLTTPAPQSFTGPLTDLRRYGAARVCLHDVRAVCERFDVTVNDVALAAISDSFRSAMLRRGDQPRAGSLRTLVPVSLRSADALHIPDNRVSVMVPLLPVDEPGVLRRVRALHDRMATAKAGGQSHAGLLAVAVSGLIPSAVVAPAVRLMSRLPQRGVVTIATNVPGPRTG